MHLLQSIKKVIAIKDFNEVIETRRKEWKFEEVLPFKTYFERVQAELQRVKFNPTPEQLDFLLDIDDGVTMVDSTAGSGKTTSIIVKSILDEVIWRIHGYHIMFLTFSKKAANDMKYRRDKFIGRYYEAKNYARMSTIHSLCFKFLETYYKEPGGMYAFSIKRLISDELVSLSEIDNSFDIPEDGDFGNYGDDSDYGDYDDYGYTPDEFEEGSISSTVSVIDIMKRFIDADKSLEYINNLNEMRNIMACFAYQKEKMLSDEEIVKERIFRSLECEPGDYFSLRDKVESYKKQFEYFDFTDLEVKTLEILQNHREFFYNDGTFQMVFKPTKLYVDEFQDMSILQKAIIRELVEMPTKDGRTTSLVVIGDSDQQIFSWRAADSMEYTNFCKFFDPEGSKAKLKLFSKNHRCGSNILDRAKMLIKNNTMRNPKDMEARDGDPGKFEISYYMNSREMISSVVNELRLQMETEGKDSLENTAIIYREHAQVMGIVTALLRLDIPFDLSGMKLPYKHWIFKNLLEICECIIFDYKDYYIDSVLHRFTSLNKKDTKIVKEQLNKMCYETNQTLGWLDVLKYNLTNGRRPFVPKEQLVELLAIKKALHDETASIRVILQKLYSLYHLHNLGYVLKNLIYCERAEIESVEFFINSIPAKEDYEALIKNISDWDRYIQNYKSMRCGVRMMTMHGTKGLEFNKVMIIGMDGDYCPKENYLNELEGQNQLEYIEEERRLFFVGITRAINECIVYASLTQPSRFLPEIDPDMKELLERSKEKEQREQERQKEQKPREQEAGELPPLDDYIKIECKNQYDVIFKEELVCFLEMD